jgi:hypothetical protein
MVAQETKEIDEINSLLTLIGLDIVYRKNIKKSQDIKGNTQDETG